MSDLNFCPECGNILPLPGLQDTVRCPRCSFSIPVSGTDERPLSLSGPACVWRDLNVTVGVNVCVCVCSPVCWPCGEMDASVQDHVCYLVGLAFVEVFG